MKTEEDEAFDELARKQGSWGGGFKAKQAMAADKMQEPEREALKLALITLEGWDNHDKWVWPETALEQVKRNTKEAITAIKEALAHPPLPAQEPYDQTALELCEVCGWKTLIPTEGCLNCERKVPLPAQEPVRKALQMCLEYIETNAHERKHVRHAIQAALAQPTQQEALYGMNQDDWKDVVAAIVKVRDGRGIYLGCRPADVFQDWFLALGTAKVKEKNG